MRKKNVTRSALITSIISLLLCVSMLVGTTFAWFTDAVTSTNNIIKSGNLDVELYYSDKVDTGFEKVNATTNVFDATLWEPGHTEVVYLKVVNEGSLALKYQLGVNVASETGSVNVDGDQFKLSDHIMFGIAAGETYATREAAVAAVAAATELDVAYNSEVIPLAPKGQTGNEKIVALVVWMPTAVGNVANHAKDAAVPTINLGLNVFATQVEAESDSFNNQYDAGAYLPTVFTVEELTSALENGDSVKLGADIAVSEMIVTPANAEMTLDLNGKKLTGGFQEGSTTKHIYPISNYGDLTIQGGTVEGRGIYNQDGAKLTVNNAKIVNLDNNGGSSIWSYGGEVYLNNANLIGYTGCVSSEGYVEINGGTYTCYSGILDDGTQATSPTYNIRAYNGLKITDGTFTSRHGVISIGGGEAVIEGGSYTIQFAAGTTSNVVYLFGNADLTINDGNFISDDSANKADSGAALLVSGSGAKATVNGGNFVGMNGMVSGNVTLYGGTFNTVWNYNHYDKLANKLAEGYEATQNADGSWVVDREYTVVTPAAGADKTANGNALSDAITSTTTPFIQLGAGEYKMPSTGTNKELTIVGTKETVIDNTLGAYLDSANVTFEGVTIKGSTGMANGNGSDYAAFYCPNVTYINCTFDGPFRIGRDGATFINCTFTNLGDNYVWTNGNDCTFENCTFNSNGKAILIYSDGGTEVAKVTVKNCVFNATAPAKAGAIANQSCACIEIQNYGNGVDLTTSGNEVGENFSGLWRIKAYHAGRPDVIVNGVEYETIAIDGKTMTIDANKNVTVQ